MIFLSVEINDPILLMSMSVLSSQQRVLGTLGRAMTCAPSTFYSYSLDDSILTLSSLTIYQVVKDE
jgi:hypothetical protein